MFRLVLLLFCLTSNQVWSTIVLSGGPKEVVIDWSGIDERNGDGTESWSTTGQTITANLSVLCNDKKGYDLTFQSANATSASTSAIHNGAYSLSYSAFMDTNGIQNASILSQNLNLHGTSSSLSVQFKAKSDVLPQDGATEANVIALHITLSTPSTLLPAGTYTDIITATASLR